MKTFTKSALTLLATTAITTSAFASSGESLNDDVRHARSNVAAISAQLDSMGVEHNAQVNFNSTSTLSQKEALLKEKHQELQTMFNNIHFSK